jgi:hypothetical protein
MKGVCLRHVRTEVKQPCRSARQTQVRLRRFPTLTATHSSFLSSFAPLSRPLDQYTSRIPDLSLVS